MFARGIRKTWKRCWRGERGAAALELGLISPFLVMFMVGVVELGTTAYEVMQAQNAVEAGAIYAMHKGYNSEAITSIVENATGNDDVTALPPTQFCACPLESTLETVQCTETCNDGGTPSQYVRIEAQITHEPLFSLPKSWVKQYTFTKSALVRLY
ncbi:MAG: pilus assembly protein [Alphaproteobacteria bacterium]